MSIFVKSPSGEIKLFCQGAGQHHPGEDGAEQGTEEAQRRGPLARGGVCKVKCFGGGHYPPGTEAGVEQREDGGLHHHLLQGEAD